MKNLTITTSVVVILSSSILTQTVGAKRIDNDELQYNNAAKSLVKKRSAFAFNFGNFLPTSARSPEQIKRGMENIERIDAYTGMVYRVVYFEPLKNKTKERWFKGTQEIRANTYSVNPNEMIQLRVPEILKKAEKEGINRISNLQIHLINGRPWKVIMIGYRPDGSPARFKIPLGQIGGLRASLTDPFLVAHMSGSVENFEMGTLEREESDVQTQDTETGETQTEDTPAEAKDSVGPNRMKRSPEKRRSRSNAENASFTFDFEKIRIKSRKSRDREVIAREMEMIERADYYYGSKVYGVKYLGLPQIKFFDISGREIKENTYRLNPEERIELNVAEIRAKARKEGIEISRLKFKLRDGRLQELIMIGYREDESLALFNVELGEIGEFRVRLRRPFIIIYIGGVVQNFEMGNIVFVQEYTLTPEGETEEPQQEDMVQGFGEASTIAEAEAQAGNTVTQPRERPAD